MSIRVHSYTYVAPYDDLDVVAGQGTIGVEILRQHSGALDYVFVQVGGGGMLAGITAYLKYLRPEIKVRNSSAVIIIIIAVVYYEIFVRRLLQ